MGNLVFQATLGGQVNLVGPNTASTFNLNVPAVSATLATTAANTFTAVQTLTAGSASAPALTTTGDTNTGIFFPAADTIAFAEGGTEAMRLDSAGNMGLGVTPSAWNTGFKAIQVGAQGALWSSTSTAATWLTRNTFLNTSGSFRYIDNGYANALQVDNDGMFKFYTAASGTAGNAITFTQAMTLDASGNLGVGTTSPTSNRRLDAVLNSNASTGIRVANNDAGGSASANSSYSNGTNSHEFGILGTGYTTYGVLAAGDAYIYASGSKNIALSSDGGVIKLGAGTNGVERARIDASGNLLVGKTSSSGASAGCELRTLGEGVFTVSASDVLTLNRSTNDGTIVSIRQDNTQEGSISVSGTTVSYNGGHLSRFAQTVAAKDESLKKGTVLSNLDEMNSYTDAEGNPVANEQLNKVKVSDVEGDANVAGVFVNWSHDEDHNVDEINMAMTGDMIIRIAQGTTVARGDLLMSAGDGTAKPQGDDIVRAKTIAKVTSTHVTCTYEDGSYCVPCVLMAC